MNVSISCPYCKQTLEASDELIGTESKLFEVIDKFEELVNG